VTFAPGTIVRVITEREQDEVGITGYVRRTLPSAIYDGSTDDVTIGVLSVPSGKISPDIPLTYKWSDLIAE